MSRYIDTDIKEDGKGRWYLETLADPNACRYLINDVCCNADAKDMVADFPDADYCATCRYFTRETRDEIEKYKDGVKTYE